MHCLTSTVLATFIPEIVLSWIPRAFHIGFMIAQPYLVKITLNYIMNHNALPVSYGYGLIGAFGFVYIGIAISSQMFNFLCFRLMVKMRGALVGIIYRDMLAVRAESKNSASAMTLMSTDVDRITMTARWVVDIIPNLVQIGLAMWILGLQLGAVCIAPLVVALLCVSAGMAKIIPVRQRRWIAAIQKRVGITSDLLAVMKGVKMMGISGPISKQIQDLRDFEISESKKFRKLQIAVISFNIVPLMSMSAVTFTVFAIVAKVSGSGTLGISQAFTSLSLLGILIMPVALLVSALGNIFQAMACLDRIQDFLLLEKRTDYRSTGSSLILNSASNEGRFPSAEKLNPELNGAVILLKEATFGWDRGPESIVLKDINVRIQPSQLTLIVGPIASGKSTLLKSILGEVYLHRGMVHVTDIGDIAYCDQDSWILNQSIRENIIAFSEYEEGFYKTVIKACQLQEDLSHLPKGDLSNVGSQGISLSGGQKQRIALARAVYSRKRIILMDDTMKGLDADTSSKCFQALFGPQGLLRRNRTAVIMATHNAQWFPSADFLIVLNVEGCRANCGSFSDLRGSDEYIRSLEPSYKQNDVGDAEQDDASASDSLDMKPRSPVENSNQEESLSKPASITHKKKEKSRGNLNSSLPYYIKSLWNATFTIFVALMIIQTGFQVIQPLWLNFWTAANAKNAREDPGKWVGIYVLFSVLNVGGMIAQFSLFLLRIVPASAKHLHMSILEATIRAPMSYFVATDVGQLVNRFSQDMTLVDFPLPIALMQTTEMFITVIGQIILTCVSSGYLAVVIPALFLVVFYVQRFYLRTSRQLRLLDLESKSPLYSFFISSFSGLTTIRAYSWADKSYFEHIRNLDTSQRPFYLLYCIQRWLMLVLNLIVAGLGVLLVGVSVALRDKVEPGLLGVALTNVTSFGMTITQLIIDWTDLETSLGAITRIREFIAETPKENEGVENPPEDWPSYGAITITRLTAKFGDHTVLDNISLDIQAGTKVAICGRTGSGKSTLLSLLLRLYDPVAGTITIDGLDTNDLKVDALREAIVALPQDPLLLAGTVRYNLDPASHANDEDILLALEKTGLRTMLEGKGGLDAEFKTEWLSSGQKQLFCLARAMLRRSKILLLDEATSSLDHQTDEVIQKLIRTEFAGWTLVVIAHRLKTIVDFDNVLVLEDGRVAEYDSPRALIEKGGLFKALWDQQEA
ncbi:P-loop containing nucleoside triphosphate hydrolase protein [Truncatella angustata]|uniref:P-loop containing nucleoside triphosphate hydrolase protein n=1 Tax=Truncatella angustata TaxID=152316 RepID=A0A9P8UQG3_9PEZI|nr:P-loop containing nucleoside triphosphate hydrolase protein [Truncatella angustata]KAH6657100.1 P-loop containing nucleoside triphosphate hydrolase protein [Truncatella angustata]